MCSRPETDERRTARARAVRHLGGVRPTIGAARRRSSERSCADRATRTGLGTPSARDAPGRSRTRTPGGRLRAARSTRRAIGRLAAARLPHQRERLARATANVTSSTACTTPPARARKCLTTPSTSSRSVTVPRARMHARRRVARGAVTVASSAAPARRRHAILRERAPRVERAPLRDASGVRRRARGWR